MKRQNFNLLCAVSVVFLVVAAVGVISKPSILSSDFEGELIFPNLVDKLNTLKKITVISKDGPMTIRSSGEGWILEERNNYPVQEEKIGELLIKLTRAEIVEEKTSLPERYNRLDLVSLDEDGESRAKQISFEDVDGNEIAGLLVGKRKFTLGATEGGTYVLMPNDPRAFVVTGEVNPGTRVRDWVVREISNIKDTDIKSVTIFHPDGEKIIVYKNDISDENFLVKNLPDGMELIRESIADDTGRTLSNLLLDDVIQQNEIEFPKDKVIKALFEGFDGFFIEILLLEDGDKNWLKISGELSSEEKIGNEDDIENNEWNKIISDLNSRTRGWAYQLPGYEVSGIKKRMEDLASKPEGDES